MRGPQWIVCCFVIGLLLLVLFTGATDPYEDEDAAFEDLRNALKRSYHKYAHKRCQIGGMCYSSSSCCSGYRCGGSVPGLLFKSCMKR